jgi:hypothetical protein
MSDELSIWTVYDHPTDYPDSYVARRFAISKDGPPAPTREAIVSPTLMPLREVLVSKGLTPIARSPEDDPKIVESWI